MSPAPLSAQEKLWRSITEAQVQNTVMASLQASGFLTYHTHDSRRSAPGFPDVVAVHPATGAIAFLEIKRETGRLTANQVEWGAALANSVAYYEIVRPSNLDEVLADLIQLR